MNISKEKFPFVWGSFGVSVSLPVVDDDTSFDDAFPAERDGDTNDLGGAALPVLLLVGSLLLLPGRDHLLPVLPAGGTPGPFRTGLRGLLLHGLQPCVRVHELAGVRPWSALQ